MKSTKAEGKLEIVKPTADNIYEQLGITEERKNEIVKDVQRIVKDAISSTNDRVTAITNVWNFFEEPTECAFAMYILNHTETEVEVHELFRLPENVGEEVNSEGRV